MEDVFLGNSKTQPAGELDRLLPGLSRVWEESLGDPEIRIAILDGQVDVSHPCFHGANLTRFNTLVSDAAGMGPMSSHGTHVTSLVFGQPGGPVLGVAPRCRGLIFPVFRDYQEGHLSQLDLARAVEQAVEEGAHIINVSGGELSPRGQADNILARAISLCERNNVLVIAAVGNDGCECLHVPAALPGVLAVGAMRANGQPVSSSNWGPTYRKNGVLAPGENIPGAIPGGGTALFTGSSFAAPLVCGVAALLLSIQRRNGKKFDPRAIREVILESALPCDLRRIPDCPRYLAGILDIPRAYALIQRGGNKTMSQLDATLATPQNGEPGVIAAEASATAASAGGVVPAGVEPSCGSLPAGQATQPAATSNSTHNSERLAGSGVAPHGSCECNGKRSNVYALGVIGFDFGTEARRDTFRQLMPYVDGVPANPYIPSQLLDYLHSHPSESTKLIWTLNLELTPIYAIEAEIPYAEEVYKLLRDALRGESLKNTDDGYVERVSVPGVLTGRTVRLFSGQVVPVVVAQPRGLWAWNMNALINSALKSVTAPISGDVTTTNRFVTQALRNFLDKVYYELRNLGQSSPDRALNYSATNTLQIANFLLNAAIPTDLGVLPPDQTGVYTLDTITVVKSPFCRMDSDCWDVRLQFFDASNLLHGRVVFQFTVDVSDELPVTLAPTRWWTAAP